jgi:hypothetical protein
VCQKARKPEIRYIWKLSEKEKEKENPKRDFILFSVWVDPFFQG